MIFDTAIMTAAGRGNAWNVALQLGGRWVTRLNDDPIQTGDAKGVMVMGFLVADLT